MFKRLICCLLLMILGACSTEQATSPTPALPALKLTRIDQQTIETQDLKGKLLILNAWATWCPPCRREMPSLQALNNSLDPQKFHVMGLTVDKDLHLAREFLNQVSVTFPNYTDPGGKIAAQLGINAYPSTLIVSADGLILGQVIGERDWNDPELKQKLFKIAAGEHHLVKEL